MLDPLTVLREAIRAVPAVKYALGVGGILAVIAIIKGFGLDARATALGTLSIVVLMVALVLFAQMSGRGAKRRSAPAVVLTWFCLLMFMAVSVALFTSVFFDAPLKMSKVIIDDGVTVAQTQQPTMPAIKSCRLREFGVERWGQSEETDGSSGWRGGGRSQNDWCRDLLNSFLTARKIVDEYKAETVKSGESSRMTWDRHAQYNYYCKLKVSWLPIYNERQDPRCETR